MPRTIRTPRKGLGRSRLAQLRSDLKLTPEARVLGAEEAVRDVPGGAVSKLTLVCSVLNAARGSYLVVGARAMQLWGTTRATKDTDILIEPTLQNAERVLTGLSRIGFGVAADIVAEEVIARQVTIIGDTPRVDILTRAWNLKWADAAPRAVTFTVEGVEIPTACIEDLIASKRTGRLQDLADIEVLEQIRRLRGG